MPEAWNPKDERQYEHIVESERERGRSEGLAQEIAARTVNKQRRAEGRVQSHPSRATGNPNAPLADLSMVELRNRARELRLTGRSTMRKAELIQAIERAA